MATSRDFRNFLSDGCYHCSQCYAEVIQEYASRDRSIRLSSESPSLITWNGVERDREFGYLIHDLLRDYGIQTAYQKAAFKSRGASLNWEIGCLAIGNFLQVFELRQKQRQLIFEATYRPIKREMLVQTSNFSNRHYEAVQNITALRYALHISRRTATPPIREMYDPPCFYTEVIERYIRYRQIKRIVPSVYPTLIRWIGTSQEHEIGQLTHDLLRDLGIITSPSKGALFKQDTSPNGWIGITCVTEYSEMLVYLDGKILLEGEYIPQTRTMELQSINPATEAQLTAIRGIAGKRKSASSLCFHSEGTKSNRRVACVQSGGQGY